MKHADLICQVIDNYGDAGIAWRLACQLLDENICDVTLWIDDPAILERWRAARTGDNPQPTIRHLNAIDTSFEPGDICITLLAAELNEKTVTKLAASNTLWIRYEYLSAEPWSDTHHCLASPHPRIKITQWFYFPGFTSRSGGLLRERDLQRQRTEFSAQDGVNWLQDQNLGGPPGAIPVCLFGYPDQPLRRFLKALSQLPQSVHIICHRQLYDALGKPANTSGLTFAIHPWFDQQQFDRLLWSCQLNLVRGEDSWVRAHWANQAFLWQPYRQEKFLHIEKLNAFTRRLSAGGTARAAQLANRLMNEISPGENLDDETQRQVDMTQALSDYLEHLGPIAQMHHNWNTQLLSQSNLTDRLAEFITDQLQ